MTELVLFKGASLPARTLDAETLIERWQEGRSPHTVRAYGRDLAHFARWSPPHLDGQGRENGAALQADGASWCHRRGFGVACLSPEIDVVALGPLGRSRQTSIGLRGG